MKLRAWYWNAFLHDFVPIYPLYAVMFGEHGVEPYALSVLLSLWSLVSLVAEVPSGALADRFSRRRLLILAGALKSGAYLTWLAWPSFWGFLTGFAVWGVAGSLRSGTLEALLHDVLEEQGQVELYAKAYGRLRALHDVAVGLSTIAGGALIRYGYEFVLVSSALFPLLSATAAALGIREVAHRQSVRDENYLALLRGGLREAVTNRRVLFIVVLSAALLGVPGMFDEYIGPVLREKGFARDWVGYAFGVAFLAGALGNVFGHRLRRVRLPALFVGLLAAGAILMAVAQSGRWWTTAGIALFFFAFAMANPLVMAWLQEAIRGGSRATVTSVNAVGTEIVGIVQLQAFGVCAQAYDFSTAAFFTGLVVALLSAGFGLFVFVPRRATAARDEA